MLHSRLPVCKQRLVWFDGEEKYGVLVSVFLVVALVDLVVNMRQTLKSPYVQRMMLMAKVWDPQSLAERKGRFLLLDSLKVL